MTKLPTAPYYECLFPSHGMLKPRAWFESNAPRLNLNGNWRFRLSPRADLDSDFAAADFDDSAWGVLPVPAHWQLHGHGSPAYTNVRYPFPIDPPRVPDDNPTGDYRRTFVLPGDWERLRILLRFDGVDSCARIWLNGSEVGITSASRLPAEFDVTGLIRLGAPNTLAVRVHQWSSGSYLEDQDMWWLSGIFRDVTLLGRPGNSISDFFAHADYESVHGSGTLRIDTDAAARVIVPELAIDMAAGQTATVKAV